MLYGAPSFNGDFNKCGVAGHSPTHMVYGASSFNGDLNSWTLQWSQNDAHGLWCPVLQRGPLQDLSTLTSTSGALRRSQGDALVQGASSFNGDLNKWGVAMVTV